MMYNYKCTNTSCNNDFDVYNSVSDYKPIEICPICNTDAIRVWTPPQFNMGCKTGYYNRALGCYIGSTHDKQAALDKYERNNGSKLIEIGNDSIKHIKPENKPITLPDKVMKDMHEYLDTKGI